MLQFVFASVILMAALLALTKRSVSIHARKAQLRFRLVGIAFAYVILVAATVLMGLSPEAGFAVSLLSLGAMFYGNKRALEVMAGLNPDYPLYDDFERVR
jgi:hypothetical protein